MALSFIVGIPSGRFFPFAFGMYTRFMGWGLYPLCLSDIMAWDLDLGVDHVSPSTPGVLLPWFSVTLLTAIALQLNEWVSRCWSAFTFPHLPSLVAFTIRACSLLTFPCTLTQSIWCHSTVAGG